MFGLSDFYIKFSLKNKKATFALYLLIESFIAIFPFSIFQTSQFLQNKINLKWFRLKKYTDSIKSKEKQSIKYLSYFSDTRNSSLSYLMNSSKRNIIFYIWSAMSNYETMNLSSKIDIKVTMRLINIDKNQLIYISWSYILYLNKF